MSSGFENTKKRELASHSERGERSERLKLRVAKIKPGNRVCLAKVPRAKFARKRAPSRAMVTFQAIFAMLVTVAICLT